MTITVTLSGQDAEQAFNELIANAEYDNLQLTIWVGDEPDNSDTSSLVYSPKGEQ